VDVAGCMAALDAEHYLQEIGAQEEKSDWLYLGVATSSPSNGQLLVLKAALWCAFMPWVVMNSGLKNLTIYAA
jgi:hypothetical protein